MGILEIMAGICINIFMFCAGPFVLLYAFLMSIFG